MNCHIRFIRCHFLFRVLSLLIVRSILIWFDLIWFLLLVCLRYQYRLLRPPSKPAVGPKWVKIRTTRVNKPSLPWYAWNFRPTMMAILWALISGVFSDLRSPEIRTVYSGTENRPYFCSQFLEGAKTSESSQNWRQFWAVSAASRNWDLLEFCVLLVPGMIRRRTPSAV